MKKFTIAAIAVLSIAGSGVVYAQYHRPWMEHVRHMRMNPEDRAALELIDEASSDLGSRFFIRIREQMGLAYFVGSSHMLGLVPAPFVFYLGTDPLKLTAVQAELMAEIKQLADRFGLPL